MSAISATFAHLPGGDLQPTDYQVLEQSWIDPELAKRAGLRRVSDLEGAAILGRKAAKHCAGMVFPYFGPGDTLPRDYRIRLDSPEMELVGGNKVKPKAKYLSSRQARPCLYFPPMATRALLQETGLPLIIIEGEKKALALDRLARFQLPNEAPRWLPVGIAGVWNWKGTVEIALNSKGERVPVKGPIPDLHLIEWKNRSVYILFDSNVQTNQLVRMARRQLAAELITRGAVVVLVDLPQEEGVNGIDDYIFKFGADAALRLIANSRAGENVSGFTVEETGPNFGVRFRQITPVKAQNGRIKLDEKGNAVFEEQSIFRLLAAPRGRPNQGLDGRVMGTTPQMEGQ